MDTTATTLEMDLLNHLTGTGSTSHLTGTGSTNPLAVNTDSHEPAPPLQQCPHCPYQCERTDKLKIHINSVHSDARPHPCNFCEKTFTLSHIAKVHERIHTGEKPYSCKFCNKKFSRSHGATIHER